MINAKDLRNHECASRVPDFPGHYKFWANRNSLEIILKALDTNFEVVSSSLEKKFDNNEEFYCIYVGDSQNINSRLVDWHIMQHHTDNQIANNRISTLRHSIASIVANDIRDEQSINAFIDTLKVEYPESDSDLDNTNLMDHFYILNIRGNNHPLAKEFKNKLEALRARVNY